MAASDQLPESIRAALANDVIHRLPLTFLPFVNQQLHQWDTLFPNERKSVAQLILYVASLNPEQSAACFREVTDLEQKMGVHQWKSFSTTEQTIENSSQLARSPFYQDWRRAVQVVFDAADGYAKNSGTETAPGNRLVLINLPRPLDLDPAKAWRRWQQIGKPVSLDLPATGPTHGILEALLVGSPAASGANSPGLLSAIAARTDTAAAETWIVDADRSLVDAVLEAQPAAGLQPVLLSHSRLDTYRQEFSHEMNTMQKDLTDADAVFDRLRKVDVLPWCPPEIASDPAKREFVRNLYLSGNGAVIFGNSFVEWASSEALRRARPRILAAKFGVRSKPKPFTGVAVFENPDQVNPLPSVDDVPGSTIDAEMLALYVWLAAARYDEYQRSTACVCVAESISQAYIVAPPEFPLAAGPQPIAVNELSRALRTWIT
jgi:hypothetical protein